MSTYPTIKFSDGNEAPGLAFGIGTAWFGRDAVDAVKTALEVGFTHLDLAQAYKNSESAGKALKESGMDPKSLFSKSLSRFHAQVDVFASRQSLDPSLLPNPLCCPSRADTGLGVFIMYRIVQSPQKQDPE